MIKKSFRVSEETWKIIEEMAKETKIKPSKVIRIILDDYTTKYKNNEKTE